MVEHGVLTALRAAGRAWKALKDQADLLEGRMRAVLEDNARPLLDIYCAGTVTAATLAIVAGDNPERIRSEAAFAKLCGACPCPPPAAGPTGTGSTEAATDKATPPCTTSP